MPNIKENCIVEWKYTIRSNYFYIIDDVVFQYDIPIKYFKARIRIFDHLKFKYWFTNKLNAVIDKSKGLDVEIKDVPPLINEPFVDNIEQYRAKIKFDVYASHFPGDMYRDYSKTWENVTKSFNENEKFGKQIQKNRFLKKIIPEILSQSKYKTDSLNTIFNYVKMNMKWNGKVSKFITYNLKDAFENKTGNVADINLLLVSILRKVGFKANPVLLSTKGNVIPYFPTIGGFNYVIAGVEMNNDIYLMDATEKLSSIDILPKRTLNKLGRMIKSNGTSLFINLEPKKINSEKTIVSIFINDSLQVEGNFRTTLTANKALKDRKKLFNLNTESIISFFEKKYNGLEIEKISLLNLNKLHKSLVISAKFKEENLAEKIGDKILISPLFFLQKKETVFKSPTRKYTIDMGYATKTIHLISIDLPKGYTIQSLPKNVVFQLKNGNGLYSYTIKTENNKIIIKTIYLLKDPIIKVEEYSDFRKMLLDIIQTESQHIVLSKN